MSNDDEVMLKLQSWWTRYGVMLSFALAAGLLAFAGYFYWQNTQLKSSVAAQALQEQMVTISQRLISNPNDKTANADLQRIGRQMMDEYARTPQAIDAASLLAARSVDANNLVEAEKHLRWALSRKPDLETKRLIEVRLARVLAAANKIDDALAVLAVANEEALAPMVQEARGDILLQRGDVAEAAKAYQAADAALAKLGEDRPLLALKLADVGLEPALRQQESVE